MATKNVSAAAIQKYLKGAKYPTNKHKIMFLAEENDAPPEVLEMLEHGLEEQRRYEGPNQIQQDIFGQEEDEDDMDPRRMILAKIEDEEEVSSGDIYDFCEDNGMHGNIREILSALRNEGVIDRNENGNYVLGRGRQRRNGRQSSRNEEDIDHRRSGNETQKLFEARHMTRGYDGRGRVRDPENDRRKKENETQELYEARHMLRGYDGRGVFHGDKEGKEFEGNKAATGGNRRKPLYKMTKEERQQYNRERMRDMDEDRR